MRSVAIYEFGEHDGEPRYFDMAVRRIEDAQRQGSLFGEAA